MTPRTIAAVLTAAAVTGFAATSNDVTGLLVGLAVGVPVGVGVYGAWTAVAWKVGER